MIPAGLGRGGSLCTQYREILTGTKGAPAVPGAVIEIHYTVYRCSTRMGSVHY